MDSPYISETKLGTFTIGKETFTLTRNYNKYTGRDGVERDLYSLTLTSDRKAGYNRPNSWGERNMAGWQSDDKCDDGIYYFQSLRGTPLKRGGKLVRVVVSGDSFSYLPAKTL